MPKRIQLRRTKGWRLPEGAVSVARPTKYGNPFKVGAEAMIGVAGTDGLYHDLPCRLTASQAVELFRVDWEARLVTSSTHPEDLAMVAEAKADLEEIRGKDLACYCAESEPCHVAVLLELANG